MAEHGRRFDERYGGRIAALGCTPVPDVILAYQGELGLSANELNYVLQVLRWYREPNAHPWIAVKTIAMATGAGERIRQN